MGQTLSAPVTTKQSDCGEDEHYLYSVSEMQGWRISMEDAHATILNLDESESEKNAFFAVYDGHGGSSVAKFSGENVHRRLVKEAAYRERQFELALKNAFLGTDDDIRAEPSFFHDPSGCTAVAALLTSDKKVYVANAGDSRSIISVKGEAKPLSYDHKPQNESESSRITAAGGFIEFGRVNGNLALSRAIGDFEFKKNQALAPERQIITANPDIIQHDLAEDDEFLVLACDGIWDCLSSQQVVDVVRRLLYEGKELTEICNQIMDICLAPDSNSGGGIGCDNMTVLVVAILNGRTKEEWYAWMKDRVANNYGYATPEALPQIYPKNREPSPYGMGSGIMGRRPLNGGGGNPLRIPVSELGFGSLARALAAGGITFAPQGWPNGSMGGGAFASEESEEEESDDENGHPSTSSMPGYLSDLQAPPSRDVTSSLRAQLHALRYDDEMDMDGIVENWAKAGSHSFDVDMEPSGGESDGGGKSKSSTSGKLVDQDLTRGEAPPPPKIRSPSEEKEQPQLQHRPLNGEEPSGGMKLEGLMDSSESPFKTD
ncbi:hypothetical protein Clacol_010038 [Clathrus columnatus]|uniref:protein-serine/threonine phosphatase n=1 Tax=Clathrus columnatus TaxID=1419009 RepID=A0AAV5AV83_9AGAM|nr:hypothetical protein Clacol_010038 [Clathrus columnatus]